MTETVNTIVQPGSVPASQTTPQPQQAPFQYAQHGVTPPQYFTAEDLERTRQQEKDKLYSRLENQQNQINEFKSTVDALMADKKTRDDELAKQQRAAEDAVRAAEEEKLSAQELIKAKQAEFEAQQEKLRQDMETKFTLMQKEQDFRLLKSFIQRRVTEEVSAGNIIPDLAEYIDGSTQEEVEASITKAKEKTASIVNGAQRLVAPNPGGVSPTGGPSGPLDNLSGPRQPTQEQIKAMNNKEYGEYRKTIGLDRAGNGQGLFGI